MISGGSSWVRLHVNDQLIGVFIRVEQYDKAFLRRYLDEDDGFLYRYDYKVPGHVERLTREDEVDPYAAALCFAPFGSGCEPPSSGLAELLGRHVDLEQLFTLAAVGGIVANWDAPFLNDNNYFWYNSEPRRRLHFAWDLDLIITEEEIGRDVHDSLLIKDNGWQLLFQNDPVLRARFDATISRLLDDAMSEEALSHFLDELEPTLASAFDADANTGLGIAFAAEVASVRDWFRRRVQIVRSQIAPSPRFPLVINEVLAANDSGIEDESGEREDWIELYNRGSEPVQLHGLYLSDDPANPAGWPLPSGTLQPGERMLVWCDGDVAPDSWHANFRLDAHGESVGLYEVTADDYRVRDFVYFGPLANDVSLARIPDGGPAFHAMRCPTPGATNRASCESDPVFIRGDASQDGVTNLTDALAILAQLFQGSSSACRLAADVDADGSLSLTDAVALLLHLFQGAPPPPAPFPACGTAAPAGDLDCVESACGSAE
jgi:hypothetical protein